MQVSPRRLAALARSASLRLLLSNRQAVAGRRFQGRDGRARRPRPRCRAAPHAASAIGIAQRIRRAVAVARTGTGSGTDVLERRFGRRQRARRRDVVGRDARQAPQPFQQGIRGDHDVVMRHLFVSSGSASASRSASASAARARASRWRAASGRIASTLPPARSSQPLDADEQQDLAVHLGQRGERALEIASAGAVGGRRAGRELGERNVVRRGGSGARRRDETELVARHGEDPRPRGRCRAPAAPRAARSPARSPAADPRRRRAGRASRSRNAERSPAQARVKLAERARSPAAGGRPARRWRRRPAII